MKENQKKANQKSSEMQKEQNLNNLTKVKFTVVKKEVLQSAPVTLETAYSD